ncbi:MAG: hypothetical protein ACK5NE_09465 [Brachymonas sp.]
MKVPTYDSFQVSPNTLPQVRLNHTGVQDIAGPQAQRMGQALTGAGQEAGRIAVEMQQEANNVRTVGALNQLKEEELRLTHDKEVGFLNIKGENALQRASGKPLGEEYGEVLQKRREEIAASLGNDAQRQAFLLNSEGMLTSFRGQILKHEAQEFNNYSVAQWGAVASTAGHEIALNPGNEKIITSGLARIRGSVESIAKLNGMSPEWVEANVRTATSKALVGAMGQMVDGNPHQARAFLDKHQDKMEFSDVVKMRETIDNAVAIYNGTRLGEDIFRTSGGPGNKGVVSITGDPHIDTIIHLESGGKADAKNPLSSATGLGQFTRSTWLDTVKRYNATWAQGKSDDEILAMRTDRDKTIEIMRWHTAVIKGQLENQGLPATIENVYSVHHFGNTKFAKAANDAPMSSILSPEALKANPYLAGKTKGEVIANWAGRTRGGKAGMAQQVAGIADPKERKYAEQTIKENAEMQELIQKEEYASALEQATDLSYAKIGGWRDVPAELREKIKPDDWGKLVKGKPKESSPDTLLRLENSPELWKAGSIEKYRSELSEADYRKFYEKGNGPGAEKRIAEAKVDVDDFKEFADKMGLSPYASGQGEKEKRTLALTKNRVESLIEIAQQNKGRVLTREEKRALMEIEIARTVTLAGTWSSREKPVLLLTPKDVELVGVPEKERKALVNEMQQIYFEDPNPAFEPTEENLKRYYLRKQSVAAQLIE